MHASPTRSSVYSYLLSRFTRILLIIFIFIIVVSLIPFHTDEGEKYRLSHYVYKPKPATPVGWTDEGWKHGYGRSGGKEAAEKSKEAQAKDKPVQDTQVKKIAFDGGPVMDGHEIGQDKAVEPHDAQELQATDRATVGVPVMGDPAAANSPYAFVFYATEDAYACGVLINIDRLQKGFKTKYRIFVLITRDLSKSYRDALASRNVTVSLQNPPKMPASAAQYYVNCLVKLYTFKMHHIDPSLRRVLVIDSDQLILQNLDHLFTGLPEVDLAAPRAYWIDKGTNVLSSTFMLINLSERLWGRIDAAMKHIGPDKYDMDIINDELGDTALVLPGKYVTINSHWETWELPKWYHEEEDFKNVEIEQPATIDANAEIAGEKVDEVAGHAGHNFHPPPENAGRHWKRLGLPLSELSEEEKLEKGMIPKPVLRRPRLGGAEGEGDRVGEKEVTADELALPAKEERKLYKELYQLYPTAVVLHFYALGKPWNWPLDNVLASRKEAHPVFYQQFKEWRSAAMESCPKGLIETL
ncbi:hypothetical protein CAC42_2885 [Sphaceloma murrayae]|uniref:Glycosyltransferase family 8 protein n=1 Tax=Sphaceloma murrayae TaxID=2082308 RepID=A0A2K1R0X4_9PEZI|nr:hypothetical protein CAC42_2885 [Sphaceloma murrayae]